METISLKTLSMARLQGNQQGNFVETSNKTEGNFVETAKKPDPQSFPHFCQPGNCWCGAKLPGSGYPSECIRTKCTYFNDGTPDQP